MENKYLIFISYTMQFPSDEYFMVLRDANSKMQSQVHLITLLQLGFISVSYCLSHQEMTHRFL